jgi:hypothetical protein
MRLFMHKSPAQQGRPNRRAVLKHDYIGGSGELIGGYETNHAGSESQRSGPERKTLVLLVYARPGNKADDKHKNSRQKTPEAGYYHGMPDIYLDRYARGAPQNGGSENRELTGKFMPGFVLFIFILFS